ncbi:GAF domain-containing protein [Saccharopolyspora sp. ASAGF58]|uniref:GAF domain-containing protein n=1 Tax=Saccharopolyspora sp. ASAGF58 TaxID=2719023 RepID=UPI00144586F5|nr:GAF domain-containing protein [Saccharopolyspora sp. ASAGF58]
MRTRNGAGHSSLHAAVTALLDLSELTADPRVLAGAVAAKFKDLVQVDRCAVFLRSAADEYRVGSWAGRRDYTSHLRGMVNGHDPFTREILERREPVVIRDSRTDPRVAQHLETTLRCDVRSMVGVPVVFGGQPSAIVYLDDEGTPTRFSDVQLDTAQEFAALCGLLLGRRREDTRSASRPPADSPRNLELATENLGRLAQRGATLGEFASAVAATLHRPVAILDSAWREVATARPPQGLRRPVGRLSDPLVRAHPRVAEALRHVATGETRTLPPLPPVGLDLRCLITPIPLGASPWGQIVVHEAGRPFDEFDRQIAGNAALRIGLSLSTAHLVATTPAELREALVGDLLCGRVANDTLDRRLEIAGIADGPHLVGVFSTLSSKTAADQGRRILDRLAPDGSALSTEIDGQLVGLIPLPPGATDGADTVEDLRGAVDAHTRRGADGEPSVIGVSSPVTGLRHIAKAYREARHVVGTLRRFANPRLPRVVTAGDIGGGLMFVSSADPADMETLVQEQLGELRNTRHARLLATLRTFLRTGTVIRCGHVLGVHENTVRYRLAKIEELTGLSVVGNPDAQMRASLALLVLRLRGDCEWHDPAA